MDTIKINLGKQVAVSQVNIRVTGSRSNKNLTEIAKVEFLNNVYKEVPKPKMNIPVINNFTSSTAVGNEAMTIGWNHETNVSGYELKVEEVSNQFQENGRVVTKMSKRVIAQLQQVILTKQTIQMIKMVSQIMLMQIIIHKLGILNQES